MKPNENFSEIFCCREWQSKELQRLARRMVTFPLENRQPEQLTAKTSNYTNRAKTAPESKRGDAEERTNV